MTLFKKDASFARSYCKLHQNADQTIIEPTTDKLHLKLHPVSFSHELDCQLKRVRNVTQLTRYKWNQSSTFQRGFSQVRLGVATDVVASIIVSLLVDD